MVRERYFLLAVLLCLFTLTACNLKQEKKTFTQEIGFEGVDAVEVNLKLKGGVLNFQGEPGNTLKMAVDTRGAIHEPSVDYDGDSAIGSLSITQNSLTTGLPQAEQWQFHWGNEMPIYLNLSTGTGLADLNLSSLPIESFYINTDRTALSINMVGYWQKPIEGVIAAKDGHVSILLPAGVPAQVELIGQPKKLETAGLQSVGDVYRNNAAILNQPILSIQLEVQNSTVSLSAGLPGDKKIVDVVKTAQMIFSQNETFQCKDNLDDGQKSTDIVSDLWFDYLCEYGPSHRVFTGDDYLTHELAESLLIQEIRAAYYQDGLDSKQDQLYFGAESFLGATADLFIKLQKIQERDFSITHFLGSFTYTIESNDDRLIFTVHNQTDRASGTRLPFRYDDGGYEISLEELLMQDPNFGEAYLLEVLMSERYPILSILDAKPRIDTEGDEGGGNFQQSFTWSEKRFDLEEYLQLDLINDSNPLDIQ